MDKENIIKFGIVGCGRIAMRHAEQILKLGKLAAACDVVPAKANILAQNFNAVPYKSIEEMLMNCDADVICICTPNGLHAQHSIAALQNGFHVICEKPMAISTSDCTTMIEAAEKANKHLFIVKQNRYNPPVQAVKKLLDTNLLGKIYSFQLNCFWNRGSDYYENSWKGTKLLDGGTLYTQFSHFIDLLYWFFGDVKDIQAQMNNFAHQGVIEFEDTGQVLLKFKNGIEGSLNYTVNSFKKNMEGSLTVFAEKGTVKIGGQYLNELEYQAIDNYCIQDLPKGNTANDYGTYSGSMSNHDKVYENVVDVLKGNATVFTTAKEGLKTVEIIERIYKTQVI